MSDSAALVLPPKPEKPDDSDCCKSDCEMCIFTVYEKKLLEWEKLCNEIKKETFSRVLHLPSVLSQFQYTPFQLLSIKSLTVDTKMYRFKVSEKDVMKGKCEYSLCLNIGIGQHLIMKNKVSSNDTLITRAYTPISDFEAHAQGYFEVMIKVYPGGIMSNYIKTWSLGEIVHWRGSFGDFKYSRNEYEHIIVCCAGTGIAPMFQLIKSIVEDDDEETFVHLLYSCKKYEEVLLSDEISKFRSFWNFSCYTFVTQEIPQSIHYGDVVIKGRITQHFFRTKFSEKPLRRTLVLICGTDSFNKDIKDFVKEMGILENHIHVF